MERQFVLSKVGIYIIRQTLWEAVPSDELVPNDITSYSYRQEMLVFTSCSTLLNNMVPQMGVLGIEYMIL